ncbi:BMP family lipoprotein [Indioceanicola profundi]|uniref:BMP family lipoprotein n=1 Tax=Indioceanicola profundi TaxID=2220096 RepID=UPI000E6AD228|nr:BMP family ABC transporter substrate-binding protein [Indioceanicola profundi]
MTLRLRPVLAGFALLLATALPAHAFEPAIVFDMGGRFDKSFNEGANMGAERFQKETGVKYRWFEVTNEAQREQFLRRLAQRNTDVIVAVGFSMAPAVEKVAKEFPKVKFTVIDGAVDLPNVQSVSFAEHEGSYLVGMLAAMASKTDTVGFVGGMDIPLIRRFACGYEQGVKAVEPETTILVNMAGTTPAAWSDPTRGAELARSQFDRGADVIFAAAGQTGMGVLQAAKDSGKLAIGVDSNQNHLFPGNVLTSMVKRVDTAAYSAFKTAQDGTWKPGVAVLGLKDEGVDWALDENNEPLISDEMKAAVESAKDEIKNGTRTVANYDDQSGCKY